MPDGQQAFDTLSQGQGYSVPKPDPTLLTTEQLMREINRIEAIIGLQIEALDERLHAEIKLTDARIESAARARDFIRGLIDEMKAGIQKRFELFDNIRREQKADIKEAVDIASLATEKALAESVKLTNAKLESNGEVMTSLRVMLDERYQTQTKALDAAFVAQQAAVATSFDASEKAMAAALLAAKEAVEKANVATEKRFDSVNELLAQQTISIGMLLPRAEAESRMADLDRRVTDIKSTVDKGFTNTDTRSTVAKDNWGYLVGALGLIAVMVTIILEVVHR